MDARSGTKQPFSSPPVACNPHGQQTDRHQRAGDAATHNAGEMAEKEKKKRERAKSDSARHNRKLIRDPEALQLFLRCG